VRELRRRCRQGAGNAFQERSQPGRLGFRREERVFHSSLPKPFNRWPSEAVKLSWGARG